MHLYAPLLRFFYWKNQLKSSLAREMGTKRIREKAFEALKGRVQHKPAKKKVVLLFKAKHHWSAVSKAFITLCLFTLFTAVPVKASTRLFYRTNCRSFICMNVCDLKAGMESEKLISPFQSRGTSQSGKTSGQTHTDWQGCPRGSSHSVEHLVLPECENNKRDGGGGKIHPSHRERPRELRHPEKTALSP